MLTPDRLDELLTMLCGLPSPVTRFAVTNAILAHSAEQATKLAALEAENEQLKRDLSVDVRALRASHARLAEVLKVVRDQAQFPVIARLIDEALADARKVGGK